MKPLRQLKRAMFQLGAMMLVTVGMQPQASWGWSLADIRACAAAEKAP